MKTNDIIIFIAILSTGLMAGIFFTWSNAVKPGIGKLDDIGYLSALQSMNRVILNPIFYIVFLSPVILIPISAFINSSSNGFYNFKLLLISSIIYWIGAFLITLFGNIPLNEILSQTTLEKLNFKELSEFRDRIEVKWNNFNLIRTISSLVSFSLLILSLFLRK